MYITVADHWSEGAANVLLVASVAAVGFVSCYLSNRFKLDASMRLFVITFLIVRECVFSLPRLCVCLCCVLGLFRRAAVMHWPCFHSLKITRKTHPH